MLPEAGPRHGVAGLQVILERAAQPAARRHLQLRSSPTAFDVGPPTVTAVLIAVYAHVEAMFVSRVCGTYPRFVRLQSSLDAITSCSDD